MSKTGPRLIGLFIMLAMMLLMTIGISAIHTSELAEGVSSGYCEKQIIFAAIGIAVFFAFSVIPYPRFGQIAYAFFGFS
ncbi:MAG TPA: hypothetical protein PLK08_08800, partial [Phycisphaerae bacterium]|nr:hypothetical protein [Phycisphaerae bacterium]